MSLLHLTNKAENTLKSITSFQSLPPSILDQQQQTPEQKSQFPHNDINQSISTLSNAAWLQNAVSDYLKSSKDSSNDGNGSIGTEMKSDKLTSGTLDLEDIICCNSDIIASEMAKQASSGNLSYVFVM